MLLVKYRGVEVEPFIQKYPDKVKFLKPDVSGGTKEWLIAFIEDIKRAILGSDIILVDYIKELIMGFEALKISYKVIFPQKLSSGEYADNKQEYDFLRIKAQVVGSYIIKDGETIENVLAKDFSWIKLPEMKHTENIKQAEMVIPSRRQLTFKDLVENDSLEITDADIRDMKALTNKFKMTMLLQAKTRLKTVVKFCDILDKLYDELINRIDSSLTTTDTASLMYTADYIAKALNEVNQFIMPLINNEKLQNFFIIDNSSVINISDSRVDINKREKIRKAAEIVLDNIDYFTSGEYAKMVNPNTVDGEIVSKE